MLFILILSIVYSMAKAYMIRVNSQRGGVGKTTIAVNLSVALQMEGYRVLLVDDDTVSPAVGFFMGLDAANIGVRDVMSGKAQLKDAIIKHDVSGVSVLPGTLSLKKFPKEQETLKLVKKLRALDDYDFIIVDTPPGFDYPNAGKFYDEALLASTPAMASITSAIRLGGVYEAANVKHNLVINKITNKRYEMSVSEIEEAYAGKVLQSLSEDPKVPFSESSHIPMVILDPKSPFSRDIVELSRFYAAKKSGDSRLPYGSPSGMIRRMVMFIKRMLGMR